MGYPSLLSLLGIGLFLRRKSQHFIPEQRGVDHTIVSCNTGWEEKVNLLSLLYEEACFDETKAKVRKQAFVPPWSSQHFAKCHGL